MQGEATGRVGFAVEAEVDALVVAGANFELTGADVEHVLRALAEHSLGDGLGDHLDGRHLFDDDHLEVAVLDVRLPALLREPPEVPDQDADGLAGPPALLAVRDGREVDVEAVEVGHLPQALDDEGERPEPLFRVVRGVDARVRDEAGDAGHRERFAVGDAD
ncbi:hypothetical protein GJ632_05560, partial [Halogeometricum sp. CBA1124]|nr:hypothetical protein [Halogeometricum sp. CBA1124]